MSNRGPRQSRALLAQLAGPGADDQIAQARPPKVGTKRPGSERALVRRAWYHTSRRCQFPRTSSSGEPNQAAAPKPELRLVTDSAVSSPSATSMSALWCRQRHERQPSCSRFAEDVIRVSVRAADAAVRRGAGSTLSCACRTSGAPVRGTVPGSPTALQPHANAADRGRHS